MNKILVAPVAFNENVKLKNVLERFLKSPVYGKVDCLVIDDASNDGTTAVIESFKEFNVKTIKHSRRKGAGAAIRTAIHYAIENQYEILVIMAGNDKDDPKEIPLLLEPIFYEGYEFVQGSRYLGQGRIGGDMPHYRKWATRLHPRLMSLFTGKTVTDSTNGFRAFRLTLVKDPRLNIDQAWLNAYELEPYLFFKALSLGYKVKEVPVTKIYPSRKLGYTKMRPFIGWWSILKPLIYLKLGIRK